MSLHIYFTPFLFICLVLGHLLPINGLILFYVGLGLITLVIKKLPSPTKNLSARHTVLVCLFFYIGFAYPFMYESVANSMRLKPCSVHKSLTITSFPYIKYENWRFEAKCKACDHQFAVRAPGAAFKNKNIFVFDTITAKFTVNAPRLPRNPGEFNENLYLKKNNGQERFISKTILKSSLSSLA